GLGLLVLGFQQGAGVVGLAGTFAQHAFDGGGTGGFGVGGDGIGAPAGTGVYGIGGLAPAPTPENPYPRAGIGVGGGSRWLPAAVVGVRSSVSAHGVYGYNDSGEPGIQGGDGILGASKFGHGVTGVSNSYVGVKGEAESLYLACLHLAPQVFFLELSMAISS